MERTGLRDLPQVLINGVPLKREQVTPDDLEETIVSMILRLTADLQKAVFNVSVQALMSYDTHLESTKRVDSVVMSLTCTLL